MVEYLVDELSKQGYHLLIEGTLRTTGSPSENSTIIDKQRLSSLTCTDCTKPELSYLSTLIRYEELYAIDPSQARATPKAHHDGIVEHLVNNLRELERINFLDKFKFIKEINRVFMIRKQTKPQQQKFYTNAYLENGTRLKKRC